MCDMVDGRVGGTVVDNGGSMMGDIVGGIVSEMVNGMVGRLLQRHGADVR